MKVYILTTEKFPHGMAATRRIHAYSQALNNENIENEILIYQRQERPWVTAANNTIGIGKTDEGVSFRYIAGTPFEPRNPISRYFNRTYDKVSLCLFLLNNLKRGDVVLLFAEQEFAMIPHLISITHFRKAYFVRELCELPFGTGSETEEKAKKRQTMLNKFFPRMDGIIAISEELKTLASRYCSPNTVITKIPILVDYDKLKIEDHSLESEIPYIFHSGTLSEQKDGILGMIESFGKACQKLPFPIKFISTGTLSKSPHADEISDLIKKYHLEDKIVFTGYLSDDELVNMLSKASLVIINKYNTQQNKYCFSTKLGEYLAASKPLIITNCGEVMHYLVDNESAYIVEPGDNQTLADKICYVLKHIDEARNVANRGRKVCKENFDIKAQSKILYDFCVSLTNIY